MPRFSFNGSWFERGELPASAAEPPRTAGRAMKPPYCAFCGKSQHEVEKLIAGPTVHICDECVGLCHDIVQGHELHRGAPRENEPGSFGCHEVLHLAAVFADMVRRHLLDHWAIRRKPAWAGLAEKRLKPSVGCTKRSEPRISPNPRTNSRADTVGVVQL
jgi:hypothetical protein